MKMSLTSDGGNLKVENTADIMESLTKEAEMLKEKLEDERQKLLDVACKLFIGTCHKKCSLNFIKIAPFPLSPFVLTPCHT